ncbi:MAG: DUF1761 domain-containing protein [Schumannella sp.]|nr:DUF1761 domain-containing protein [Microbacteriaceae bacterium]
MTVPTINYIAVVLATISSMIVGAVWYTPKVFGNYWMKLSGQTPSGNSKDAVRPIIVTVIVSFVTAWVLAGAADISFGFYGGSFLVNALVTGAILWAGFTAARFITHDQFDRRPWQLTVLNCAHELVTILIMALIIGVWPA